MQFQILIFPQGSTHYSVSSSKWDKQPSPTEFPQVDSKFPKFPHFSTPLLSAYLKLLSVFHLMPFLAPPPGTLATSLILFQSNLIINNFYKNIVASWFPKTKPKINKGYTILIISISSNSHFLCITVLLFNPGSAQQAPTSCQACLFLDLAPFCKGWLLFENFFLQNALIFIQWDRYSWIEMFQIVSSSLLL